MFKGPRTSERAWYLKGTEKKAVQLSAKDMEQVEAGRQVGPEHPVTL